MSTRARLGRRGSDPFRIASLVVALLLGLVSSVSALTLTGFSPAGAPPNTWITLTGTEFTTVSAVRFNGTSASFNILNDTQINAYVPGSATTGPISVSNGTTTAYSPGNFFVGNAPYISGFTPTGGGPGTSVTINGSYFVSVSSVKFNNVSAAFTVNSSNQIVATVPAGAATGNVSVTNPAGTYSTGTFYFPPSITSFAPAGGLAGTSVTLVGTNFNIVSGVQFNGVGAGYSVQDNNRLVTTVPSGATTGPISVQSFAGSFTSANAFFVGAAPTVTQASPAGGPPGTSVIIDGTGFVNVTAVTFNGVTAPFSVESPTQIVTTVPGGASTGPLAVSNPTGTGTWSSTYFVGNAPTVTAFSPTSGPVGSAVTVNGTGFVGATSVKFSGVEAADFVVHADGELAATVPVGASTGPVTVSNAAGSGQSSSHFAVTPQVLAASPMSAPASTAVGTQVEVYGHNFTGAWLVTLGGTPAGFLVVDDTHLTLWVPAGATSGPIEVSTLVGSGASAFSFEVVKFTAPPHSPFASWPMDLWQNLPVATGAPDQTLPATCPDSTGGVYVAWIETDETSRLMLQRITAYGERAPGWPQNGIVVGYGAGSRSYFALVPDLVGGVLLAWADSRNGNWDLYATRIRPDGSVESGWSPGGTAVCTSNAEQSGVTICTDGSSGAFVAWQDYRNQSNWDIYVHHLLATGARDPEWPVQGLAIATDWYSESDPTVAADGLHGAYVCWRDTWRNIPWLQHIAASSLIAPGWPASGLQVGGYNFYYSPATLVPDAAGNVIVVWAGSYPVALKITGDGSVSSGWPSSGRPLHASGYVGLPLRAVGDGKGGVFAVWPYNGTNMLAQHLTTSGAYAPGWPSTANWFRSEANNVSEPVLTSDASGGAIAGWLDSRSGEWDVYAQRFSAANTSAPLWQTNGAIVCVAPNHQTGLAATFAGTPGAVFAWVDRRVGGYDIYAQNLTLAGKPGNLEPHILSVRDVVNDQGGRVRITWQRSALDTMPTLEIATYGVWRRVTAAYAQARMRLDGTARMVVAGDGAEPGTFRTTRANAEDTWWEGLASIPARGQTTYSFVAATLADSGSADAARETYMVDAHATFGSYFWSSDADSGSSVDNLPPAAPLAFTAAFQPNSTWLHWHRNSENDLAEYRVYRGASPAFEPSAENLVGATTDTALTDPHAGYAYYKLVAVDVHDNASATALAVPPTDLDVPASLPAAFALGAATPNPAHGRCDWSLQLPRAARVDAAVFDAAGRRVRTLSAHEWAAGSQALHWDLCDDAGAPVADGLYFVRLETGGFGWTRRVAVLH